MQLTDAAMDEYLALVRAFPLLSIRDDAHLRDALAMIDQLIDKSELSEAEEAYLDALTDLVETYENAHVDIPPVTGVEALRYLMEVNGLKQSDLAHLFGSPSIISEVLSGKRRLALSHMEKLAAYFGLPISVFSESADSEAVGQPAPAGSVMEEYSRLLAAIRSTTLRCTLGESRKWLSSQGSSKGLFEELSQQRSSITEEYSKLLAAIHPASPKDPPQEKESRSTAGSQTARHP